MAEINKSDEIGQIINQYFVSDYCQDFALFGQDETCMGIHYKEFAKSIENFEVRDSDVFVISYPKCGTTWLQEAVWLIANDLDYERAKVDLSERFPFLEICTINDFGKMKANLNMVPPEYVANSLEFSVSMRDPRFIKTHLPFSLLPQHIKNGSKKPKIVYITRNPKDVCVSYWHHGKLLNGWNANLQDFSKVYLAGKVMYGCFWKHVFSYWNYRALPNILILTYEEMKHDLPASIRKIAYFFNKNYTDDQVIQLSKHLSFDSMKFNNAVNKEQHVEKRRVNNLTFGDGKFMRAGQVGKHKEEMTQDLIQKLDEWNKKNVQDAAFLKKYGYLLN